MNNSQLSTDPPTGEPADDKPGEAVVASGPLETYFSDGRLGATKFLNGLAKARITSLEEADKAAALGRLSELDPDLKRTLALAHKAFASRATIAPAIMRWVGSVAAGELSEAGSWRLDPEQSAEETARSIGLTLRPLLADRKTSRRAAALLALSLLWIAHSRQLAAEPVADAIQDSIPRGKHLAPTVSQMNRTVIARLTRPPVSIAGYKSTLSFLALWLAKARAAESEAAESVSEARRARDRAEEAEARIAQLAGKVAELQEAVARGEKEREQLREQLVARGMTAEHDLADLRGRQAGFLERRVLAPLDNAGEALRMDPPRTAVAEQRIEDVRAAVEQEIKWLRSSE